LCQHSVEATRVLCEALGLGMLNPGNLKYLALALTRAATDGVSRNDAFAEQVCFLYQALLPAVGQALASMGARRGRSS